MSARPASRGRGMAAAALTSVAGWLVEPAEAQAPPSEQPSEQPLVYERPVIAVTGLHRRCGVTTVARAVGAELAARDPSGSGAVTTQVGGGAVSLGFPAASRLARALGPVGAHRTRTAGRLCLVDGADRVELCATLRFLAPLVIDVGDPTEAGAAAALADGVVVVCGPAAEPALAAVVAESLEQVGPPPAIVVNRMGPDPERWEGRCHVCLPDSRMGAHVAQSGREPRGVLGDSVARLVDRWSPGE